MIRNISSGVPAVTLLILSFFLFAHNDAAQVPELRVLSSDGMEAVMTSLTPKIERSTGRKLKSTFDSSKSILDLMQAGEAFDVAILTTATIDDLIKQGKIMADSRVEIASSAMGVGIRAGAPKPDISTPEAMKQTLLKAKTITFNPTGATATLLNKMFDRLGVADDVKPKIVPDTVSGGGQKRVADGKVDLVITLIPEIKGFPGLTYVGPLPEELNGNINFAAGVATNSKDPEKAKALLRLVTAPAAVPTIKAKGMVPHS